jgi:hypothetical protein
MRRKAKTVGSLRRRHDANRSADLLAHVCEVMELFPVAGEQAIAELVGKMQTDRPAGAAAGKRRRAGSRRHRRRK